MLDSVRLLGLCEGPVIFGGPEGPQQAMPGAGRVLALYEVNGWQPDKDEAAGHNVLRVMETVGNAAADGSYSAQEAAAMVALLAPQWAKSTALIAEVSDRVFRALADDGRISRSEAVAIVWGIASALGSGIIR